MVYRSSGVIFPNKGDLRIKSIVRTEATTNHKLQTINFFKKQNLPVGGRLLQGLKRRHHIESL